MRSFDCLRYKRPGLPPVRAAALSGYKSLSYFSNCFKRAYGKPPSRT